MSSEISGAECRKLASKLNIAGRSKMRIDELRAAVKAASEKTEVDPVLAAKEQLDVSEMQRKARVPEVVTVHSPTVSIVRQEPRTASEVASKAKPPTSWQRYIQHIAKTETGGNLRLAMSKKEGYGDWLKAQGLVKPSLGEKFVPL